MVTSTTLIDVTDLPGWLAVVGAGAIGLELAAVHRKFGSDVTAVNSVDRLLPAQDENVAEAVTAVRADARISLVLGATVRQVIYRSRQ